MRTHRWPYGPCSLLKVNQYDINLATLYRVLVRSWDVSLGYQGHGPVVDKPLRWTGSVSASDIRDIRLRHWCKWYPSAGRTKFQRDRSCQYHRPTEFENLLFSIWIFLWKWNLIMISVKSMTLVPSLDGYPSFYQYLLCIINQVTQLWDEKYNWWNFRNKSSIDVLCIFYRCHII